MSEPLLIVEDLEVTFPGRTGVVRAVRDAPFSLGRERLGIVGESGSGKSTTGRALLGLVPRPGIVTARTMSYAGEDLLRCLDPRPRVAQVAPVGREAQAGHRR